uniref:Ionotropic glutamate receptor L-glutamate and glycine-binding domain-containing protein n=1 Tax=Tetranychus urticae TaxID=32264 RepID=T1KMD3_TETUR
MQKVNLTVGAFSVPLAEGFVEEDDQLVPKLKSLKRFAAILSDYGHFNLKFILPEEGQLGLLTETGYHDGVLGLMQEGKADMGFLPLSLDTQKAPGYFTSVISEEKFYIASTRILDPGSSAVVSSLTSVTAIPLLSAVLSILILELIAVKSFKIDALLTAIFRSFGISFYQNISHRSSWLCLIQMLILMFPVFIFNAAFSTQTIVGDRDYKIETLKDVVRQNKIPYFTEGISMYDFFKGKVNEDYADVYERAVAKGYGEPFPLGPIPMFERRDKMFSFVSSMGRKLTPLVLPESDAMKANQIVHFSTKPFHRALKALFFSYNASESVRRRTDTISLRMFKSGIVTKIESDIYVDFLLSFYPTTLYEFYKTEVPRKVDNLNWHSLNYTCKNHPYMVTRNKHNESSMQSFSLAKASEALVTSISDHKLNLGISISFGAELSSVVIDLVSNWPTLSLRLLLKPTYQLNGTKPR